MRIILVFILFLLFGVTEGKTQRLNDEKSQRHKDTETQSFKEPKNDEKALCDSATLTKRITKR